MKNEPIILLDGAMGTELRDRGCTVPSHVESIWSAQVLLEAPETIVEVHKDYISAGSEIIIANNYAVTHDLLGRVGMGHRVGELTELALNLAHKAKVEHTNSARVAGSLPPLNTSYRADLVGESKDVVQKYAEILEVLVPKSDLVIIETMSSSREAIAALQACKGFDIELWLSFTLHGNRKNTLPSGETLEEAIKAVLAYDFQTLMVNCCASNQLTEAFQLIPKLSSLPFGGYANPERIENFQDFKGLDMEPEISRNKFAVEIDVPEYIKSVEQWLDQGASILGGCCRTKPEHIQRMAELIRN